MVLNKLMFASDFDNDEVGINTSRPRKRKTRKETSASATPDRGLAEASNIAVLNDDGRTSRESSERLRLAEPLPLKHEPTDAMNTLPEPIAITDKILDTTEVDTVGMAKGVDAIAQALEDQDIAEGAIILDPKNSERKYYRDPVTGLQREIWRPGDGNGDKSADYYDKPGAVPPVEKRWRFYQSRTGIGPVKREHNEPPKYVILDDRAAREVLTSDLHRQALVNFWGHDFGGNGSVRARRPHRGRGAIGDSQANGEDRYHFVKIGSRGDKYYFTGEKDYKAIIYRTTDPKLAVGVFQPKKKKELTPPRKKELAPNKHGHNQFTPKDQMVKYGAPHKGVAWLRYKERLNTYLPKEPSPERMWEGKRVFTETEKHLAEVAARETPAMPSATNDDANKKATEEAESLWPDSDEQSAPKRRKQAFIVEDEADGGTADMGVGERLAFPYGAATNLVDPEDYPVSTDPSHRTKLREEPDYFAQLLAEPDVTNGAGIGAITIAENGDSGSYASNLEAELAEARKTISAQKVEIEGLKTVNEAAKAKVTALEQEISTLKGSAEDMETFINPEFFQ